MDGETAHDASPAAAPAPPRETILTRGWPALPAAVVLVVVLVRLAFDQGGYFPAAFTSGGAIALVALAVLIVYPARQRFAIPALVGLGALAALACWSGLSGSWSLVPDVPLQDMQRALLYLGLFALGLLAADSARRAGLLVWGVLGVVLVVVGAGVLSRLQPDLVAGATLVPGQDDTRLSYPLGYWNAFGALATIGGVLAIGLAADPRAARILRALASAAAVVLLVAMYLSLSRGAWLSLIAGILALLVLSRYRGTLLASLLVVGAAVAAALLMLRSYPALVDGPRVGDALETQGDAFTLRLAAVTVLAAGAQWLLTETRMPARVRAAAARALIPVLLALVGVLAAVPLAGLLVRDDAGELRTVAALDDVSSWASRQWDDFVAPSTPLVDTGTSRLLSAKNSRVDQYRVALDGFQAQPLRGEGAGSYEVRFMRTREVEDKVRDAHSLPLQTLAELGIVGFVLLLAFVGAVLVALSRARSGKGALRRSQSAAVGAAFFVWLVHASLDWDWEMPAVTGAALVLAATLFASGQRRSIVEGDAGAGTAAAAGVATEAAGGGAAGGVAPEAAGAGAAGGVAPEAAGGGAAGGVAPRAGTRGPGRHA